MTLAAKPEGYLESPIEQLLTERCVQGDQRAWATMHRQYYSIVISFLRRLGVKEADIEDANQEVFLQIFRYLHTFRGEAEIRTWLYQLCITQARRCRRQYYVRDVLDRVLVRSEDKLVGDAAFSEEDALRRVDAALSKLSEAERIVFVLYEIQGASGKEIARIVGAKETTVWRRLHYARKNFRAALGVEPEEPS